MRTRELGWTGEALTVIGLGTWAHGGGQWAFSWGPQDDRASADTLRAALDAGVNWIDTAPVYGLGHAEEVLGGFLKGLAQRPFIATKCGRVWDESGRVFGRLTAGSVRAECEASLRRLGVDCIDLLQLHWPDPVQEIDEGWQTIGELIKEGKVRYGGVSNFHVNDMRRLHAMHPIASAQPPYSMLKRDAEQDVFAFCREQRIGIVAYSPLQKGLLTGKVTKAYVDSLPDDDHRKRDPMFRDPRLSTLLPKIERLREVAERNRLSLTELAIAWVLRRPEITAAIVGARKPGQTATFEKAAAMDLPGGDQESIEIILES